MSVPPFSSRNHGAHAHVDNDCPESARTGLLHLLYQVVEREYVGWPEIARELQRIARLSPGVYSSSSTVSINEARNHARTALLQLPWDKVYDFCERLHGNLVQEVWYRDNDDERIVTSSKSDAQNYVSAEIQRVFVEEHLGIVRK